MSHVDDGTLHTYLDGALDSLGSAEAVRVREHLASCEECARRLEQEAALRDEAAAVLAGAVPEVGDLPSFDDLRTRAAMARSRSAGWRIERLAWAASVVVALGTGWMLRGASVPGGVEGAPAVRVLSPSSDEAEGPALSPAPVATTQGAGATEGASTQLGGTEGLEPPPVASAESLESQAGAGRGDPDLTGVRVAEALAGAQAQKMTDSVAVLSDRAAVEAARAPAGSSGRLPGTRDSSLVGVALERQLIAPEQRQPIGLRAAAPPGDAALRAARDVQPSARADALPAEAEERSEVPLSFFEASQPLVLPGLEVISVTWLKGADLDGAVRVLHRMERGDTLELIHLPPGIDPGSIPAVSTDGRTEVVLPRGAGWVVARARLAREDLEGILRELNPALR
jgi:hypothetical protein